ncbi:MAG: LamG domain-containing protein, partial [Anaerolineales bacterium]|nr:LamG domain-containing protein [Anaerolineales bacterium]
KSGEYRFTYESSYFRFRLFDGGHNAYIQSPIHPINEWTYLVVTYDGRGGVTADDGLEFYVNGIDVSPSRVVDGAYVAMGDGSNPVIISGQNGGGRHFNGTIDEVRILNRSLTAAEVLADYRKGATGLGLLDNSYIKYSTKGNLNEREGTIEFWVKPEWDNSEGPQRFIFRALSNVDHNMDIGILQGLGEDDLHVRVWDTSQTFAYDSSGWLAGDWHHLAVTWNNYTSNRTLHADGVQVNQTGVPFGTSPAPEIITIGSREIESQFCNCTISEFRISRKALTAQEINHSFSKGRKFLENEIFLNSSNYKKDDSFKLEYTARDADNQTGKAFNSTFLTFLNSPPTQPS